VGTLTHRSISTDYQNPLSFSLSFDLIQGDVGEAVENVSNDIVASSKSCLYKERVVTDRIGSKYMPAIYELRSQLSDRASKLRYLISFVRESGMMNKVSYRKPDPHRAKSLDHPV